MKTRYTAALSMLAGVAVGALAIQGLHAQAKPPVYVIAEIDISNPDAYAKEFLPLVQSNLGTAVAAGKGVTIEGEPAKSRVTVRLYDSIEAAKAAYNLPAYKEARKIGDKYAKFHIFAVEGVPK